MIDGLLAEQRRMSAAVAAPAPLPEVGPLPRYKRMEILWNGMHERSYLSLDQQAADRWVHQMVVDPELSGPNVRADGLPPWALRLASTLREIDHPNIISLLDVVLVPGAKMQLIFEYHPINLRGAILGLHSEDRARFPFANPTALKRCMYQLFDALDYCHRRGIVHQDVCTNNIQLTKADGSLKLTGFQLSRVDFLAKDVRRWNCAPEVLLGEARINSAMDLWSAGCILFEMVIQHPFRGDSEIGQLVAIFQLLGTPYEPDASHGPAATAPNAWRGVSRFRYFNASFPRWPPKDLLTVFPTLALIGAAGLDLLQRLLTYDPEARISARGAMMHPWFDGVRPSGATPTGPEVGATPPSEN